MQRLRAHDVASTARPWPLAPKGLDEPIELFEASAADPLSTHARPTPTRPIESSAARTSAASRRGAPHLRRTRSVHRPRSRVARAGAALRRGARMISLLGIGGTGKTRLAQHYGWTARRLSRGVWFCDLAQARRARRHRQRVAPASTCPRRDDPVAQLGAAIDRRCPCLLIPRQLRASRALAPATVGLLARRPPQARFILTTRGSRPARGGDGGRAARAARMRRPLFGSAQSAARSDFKPTADASVQSIRWCGSRRVPLAIELAQRACATCAAHAAARMRESSTVDLARRTAEPAGDVARRVRLVMGPADEA